MGLSACAVYVLMLVQVHSLDMLLSVSAYNTKG